MWTPTRLKYGEGRRAEGKKLSSAPFVAAGVVAAARTEDIMQNVGDLAHLARGVGRVHSTVDAGESRSRKGAPGQMMLRNTVESSEIGESL